MGLFVGVARAAYEAALEYAQTRYKNGNLIIFHEPVALMLADMNTKIECARLLLWKACRNTDTVGRATALPTMVKVYSSDVAMEVTTNAVQIFGGYGYMRDFKTEKYMRDAKLLQIYHGANEVLRWMQLPYMIGTLPMSWRELYEEYGLPKETVDNLMKALEASWEGKVV